MGQAGNHAGGKNRQLLEVELEAPQMPLHAEADLIGNVVVSVLRDFGVGGHYGKVMFDGGAIVEPALSTVYQPDYAEAVAIELTSIAVVKSAELLLYTGWGDMIGNLSRLLVVARETAALEPLLSAANSKIATLGMDVSCMSDGNYIRHIRNAVVHARFGVQIDESDPFTSKIVFIDVDPRAQEITAKFKLTAEQLAQLMRIIIHEVFEKYLLAVGWESQSSKEST
ncbi:hypothetical protein [Leucobacter triazinivorans]|uniref:Uncharacterized protein n=1 Tax=Leucobacter triazinivorans TaxID=1784719 RepID=A0A4P6KES1_9MICO|nr:hypothetical protein [Leucobacter triazinivorans]QBE48451.1 hypothetical protein EVS81_06020 [Leucobacter triazinivorans]